MSTFNPFCGSSPRLNEKAESRRRKEERRRIRDSRSISSRLNEEICLEQKIQLLCPAAVISERYLEVKRTDELGAIPSLERRGSNQNEFDRRSHSKEGKLGNRRRSIHRHHREVKEVSESQMVKLCASKRCDLSVSVERPLPKRRRKVDEVERPPSSPKRRRKVKGFVESSSSEEEGLCMVESEVVRLKEEIVRLGEKRVPKYKPPEVQFSVNAKVPKDGTEVHVCGNIPEMGGGLDPFKVLGNGIVLDESECKGELNGSRVTLDPH